MRSSDWSSDVCSSDLRLHVVIGGDEAIDLRPRGREIVLDLQRDRRPRLGLVKVEGDVVDQVVDLVGIALDDGDDAVKVKPRRLVGLQLGAEGGAVRSEEHTSELQSLMRNSYAVF